MAKTTAVYSLNEMMIDFRIAVSGATADAPRNNPTKVLVFEPSPSECTLSLAALGARITRCDLITPAREGLFRDLNPKCDHTNIRPDYDIRVVHAHHGCAGLEEQGPYDFIYTGDSISNLPHKEAQVFMRAVGKLLTERGEAYIQALALTSDLAASYKHRNNAVEKRFCPIVDPRTPIYVAKCLYRPSEFTALARQAGLVLIRKGGEGRNLCLIAKRDSTSKSVQLML